MTDLPGTPTSARFQDGDPPPRTAATATGEPSTAEVARAEASTVKDTAVSGAHDVASTAKAEAGNLAREATRQTTNLLETVRSELRTQGGVQQRRLATAAHSLSDEVGAMASASKQPGPLTDLMRQASQRGGEVASWLEDREPADVLDQITSFGRRRPVAFLGLCFLAGLAAGRVARGAVAARTDLDSAGSGEARGSGAGRPGTPAAGAPTVAANPLSPPVGVDAAAPVAPPSEPPIDYGFGTAGAVGVTRGSSTDITER
jgi:hypothetical protein